jgi:5-methylcytosine-specific restriction endonuclease McrA
MCGLCDRRISEEVDHIVPAREAIAQAQASGLYPLDRYAGYYFRSNLRGLCRLCHRGKTLEEKTHTGAWPDVVAREQAAPKRRFAF